MNNVAALLLRPIPCSRDQRRSLHWAPSPFVWPLLLLTLPPCCVTEISTLYKTNQPWIPITAIMMMYERQQCALLHPLPGVIYCLIESLENRAAPTSRAACPPGVCPAAAGGPITSLQLDSWREGNWSEWLQRSREAERLSERRRSASQAWRRPNTVED